MFLSFFLVCLFSPSLRHRVQFTRRTTKPLGYFPLLFFFSMVFFFSFLFFFCPSPLFVYGTQSHMSNRSIGTQRRRKDRTGVFLLQLWSRTLHNVPWMKAGSTKYRNFNTYCTNNSSTCFVHITHGMLSPCIW